MRLNVIGAMLLTGSMFVSSLANAGIVSVTGDAQINTGTIALDLSHGAVESNLIQGFSEDANVVINQAITVDFDIASVSTSLSGFDTEVGQGGGTGSLAAGTYNSYLLHFDPIGSGSAVNATFTFTGNILALIVSIDNLQATDGIFNSVTTDYNSGDNVNGRRSESTDLFSFVGNVLTVSILSTNSTNVDHIRVLTVADPVVVDASAPASILFVVLGAGLLAFRRFK